jgi:hypothetical protein
MLDALSPKENEKVRGVIIRCDGEIEANREENKSTERYYEVEVAKDHAIWKEPPTEASRFMGLPLLLYRLPIDSAWVKGFVNPAIYLNLMVDPKKAEMRGFAPKWWQLTLGNVLVVRKDGKNLSREQAWALTEYMQSAVTDAFAELEDNISEQRRRAVVLKTLNWAAFETWLEGFKKKMAATNGESWAGVSSPFETKQSFPGSRLR